MQHDLMSVQEKLSALFGPKRASTLKDLGDFLESRAAYVAQKSLAEYTQARANMMFSTLLNETGFRESYEEARWKAYPAALSMVAEVLTGQLRDRLKLDEKRAETIIGTLGQQVIGRLRGHGPLSESAWDQALLELQQGLARSTLAAPLAAHAVARHRAHEVFDALPFHRAIKQHDFPMFSNTMAFHLTEIAAEFEQVPLSAASLALPD